MAIYAIGDLHLSFGNNKPMDIFGDNWVNHEEKIRVNWMKKVKEDDLVIILGDFSWAMYLEDTIMDFQYLNSLPGHKILLKGNHDYWWSTLKKMENYVDEHGFKNIEFLQNNSYLFSNKIIVGTRGWSIQEDNAEKMLKRENLRLKLSIENGIERFGTNKEIIVFMHYPPVAYYEEESFNLVSTMKKYKVKKCIYGHLHGKVAHEEAIQGNFKGIEFNLASSDFLNFNLLKISE